MPEERNRSLFWPLALILAGIALLLDQLGLLDVSWSMLWRFWPLLLVLIGLDVLLGRTRLGGVLFAIIAVLVVGATLYWAPVVQPVGTGLTHRTYDYAQSDITGASITIEPGVGKLIIDALDDSPNLIEAAVDYDLATTDLSWRTDRKDDEAVVELSSRQQGWQPDWNQDTPTWEIALAPETPLSLYVNGGVNQADIDLSRLYLRQLDIELGVGEIDLRLPENGGYRARISGGIGNLSITLPDAVEARITVDGGIGNVDVDKRFQRDGDVYVSKGYSEDGGVDLRIDGGIGQVRID